MRLSNGRSKEFEMKKILVTGGAGFVGSNLCARLVKDPEHFVIALDNLFTGRLVNIASLSDLPNFRFVELDIQIPIDIECDRLVKELGNFAFFGHVIPLLFSVAPLSPAFSALGGAQVSWGEAWEERRGPRGFLRMGRRGLRFKGRAEGRGGRRGGSMPLPRHHSLQRLYEIREINPYTFTVTGTGIQQSINVQQSGTIIGDTGTYAFQPDVVLGQVSSTRFFTIQNPGTYKLTLSSIGLTSGTVFKIVSLPGSMSIPAGGSATFAAVFTPSASGGASDILTVASDAPGTLASYTFTLTGNCIAPVFTLSTAAHTFANTNINAASADSPFTVNINNTGTSPMGITGISLSGANTGDFVLDTSSTLSTVPAGGSIGLLEV